MEHLFWLQLYRALFALLLAPTQNSTLFKERLIREFYKKTLTPMSNQILDLMRMPGSQELYILGCFGRHITLYSQQVRAINLAYSLNKIRDLKGVRIGVVGAGAAGLTFTVAAARLGAEVVLLEKLPGPMGTQRGSGKRFVHPHIFDWPENTFERDEADLPFLNWRAGFADKVVEQIETKWEKEQNLAGNAIVAHWGVRDVNIETETTRGNVILTWNEKGPRDGEFEIVVLAVGFGLEKDHDGTHPRYWEDDRLSKVGDKRQVCLIAGCGDSALTDLMRLCVQNFQHDRIVKQCAFDAESRRQAIELQGLEKSYLQTRDSREIREFFNRLEIESMKAALEPAIRPDTDVYLTAKSLHDVYGSKSSILNRIIVSQLAKLGAWKFKKGPIILPVTRNSAQKYEVSFEQTKGNHLFDILVIRHGPDSVLASDFAVIDNASNHLKERWKELPQHLDPTRKPLEWGDVFLKSARVSLQAQRRQLRKPVRMVAFDLDGTLLQEDGYIWSWQLLWRFLGYDDVIRIEMMNRALNCEKKANSTWYQDWCDESADYFRQKDLKRSDFEEVTKNLVVAKGFREVIATLKNLNIKLFIISGGIDVFLEEKIPDWRELFDHAFINQFSFNNDGLFQRIKSTPYDFEGKWTCIEELCRENGWDSDQVVFVGDGFNDEYVLGRVGKAIGFNASGEVIRRNADVKIESNDLRDILPEIL